MSSHSTRGKGRRDDGGECYGMREGAGAWCCAAGVGMQGKIKTLPEVKWSPPGKIHLLSGLHQAQASLKLVKKGMG